MGSAPVRIYKFSSPCHRNVYSTVQGCKLNAPNGRNFGNLVYKNPENLKLETWRIANPKPQNLGNSLKGFESFVRRKLKTLSWSIFIHEMISAQDLHEISNAFNFSVASFKRPASHNFSNLDRRLIEMGLRTLQI